MQVVVAAVLGLLIGSFLTVVVDRVPRGASIVAPGSTCGSCGRRLGVPDLVPVLSWVALRGRCRSCGARIGIEPVMIEVVTAALFVATVARFGGGWYAAAQCVLVAGLVALAAIDLRTHRLPREISYTVLAIGAVLLVAAAVAGDDPGRIGGMLVGTVLYTALLGIVYVVSRGGMGDGDVRLAPTLGLYLGWVNPALVFASLFLAALAGSVVGIALIATGQGGRKTAVPFGPFLAAGTLVALFVGQPLVDAVLGG